MFALAGCPTFEDEMSGKYREIPNAENPSAELMEIDLFRFGDYANAVVRRYQAGEDGEPDEIDCAWSTVTDAPVEGELDLTIPKSATRDQLVFKGSFTSPNRLQLTRTENGQTTEHTFELFSQSPSNRCDVIGSFLLQPTFTLNGRVNEWPDYVERTMVNPTFALLWVGVQAQRQNNVVVWVGTNDHSAEFPLGAAYQLESARGLRGSVSLSIPPPQDKVLIENGETRYSLAHFVVIDDTSGESDGFNWNVSEEPIVATTLQLGSEVDSPFPTATGLGKALLYVEGTLQDLSPNIRARIVNLDAYLDDYASANYYIVDVFYENETVLGVRLPPEPQTTLPSPTYRRFNLEVTDRFLNARQILLPRFQPYD